MLQSTFERLNKFIPSTNIISVTNSKHHANVKMQLDKFNGNSIVLPEPVSKNTAPAIALSVKYIIENSDDDETVLVVPSDLLIEDNEKFIQSVKEAEKFVEQGKIVTFGVKPSYAETGYGYIKSVDSHVVEFCEKPNLETAEKYLNDGGLYIV